MRAAGGLRGQIDTPQLPILTCKVILAFTQLEQQGCPGWPPCAGLD